MKIDCTIKDDLGNVLEEGDLIVITKVFNNVTLEWVKEYMVVKISKIDYEDLDMPLRVVDITGRYTSGEWVGSTDVEIMKVQ